MGRAIAVVVWGTLLTLLAQAGEILKIKDNRVLLEVSDLPEIQKSDELISIDRAGNRTSVLRIRAVRSNQAVAEIVEGDPRVGQKVRKNNINSSSNSDFDFQDNAFNTPRSRSEASPIRDEFSSTRSIPRSERAMPKASAHERAQTATANHVTFGSAGTGMGGYLTYANHNLSIELQSKNRGNFSGSSLNFGGFYDYDYSENFTLRLNLLWEQFSVSGNRPAVTDCSGPCEIKFNYLSFGGMLQYNISRWGSRYWVGGGSNFMFQLSQSNNLNGTRFTNTTNQNFSLGLGADFGLSQHSYLPVFVQYDLFLGANPANSLHLGLGYGIRF
jgi:hypothetical protein